MGHNKGGKAIEHVSPLKTKSRMVRPTAFFKLLTLQKHYAKFLYVASRACQKIKDSVQYLQQ
jgi:hypothetical protein